MKTVNFRALILLLCLPLLLCQCASTTDVQNLNLRLRSLNNMLVEMEQDVEHVQTTAGTSVDHVQRQQAGIGDSVDRMNNELLQIKAQLDEGRHRARNVQSENKEMLVAMDSRIFSIVATVSALSDRLAALENGFVEIREVRAREAAARAEAARAEAAAARAAEAEAARKRALEVKKKSGLHEITPVKVKKKGGSDIVYATESTTVSIPQVITSADSPDQQLYDQALDLFKIGKYQQAYDLFSDYSAKYPSSSLTVKARFWSADAMFKQKEYALSILEYQNVIADYPRHAKAPAALLKQGLAFEALQDDDTARIVYNKIVSDYPGSEQAATARDKLKKLK